MQSANPNPDTVSPLALIAASEIARKANVSNITASRRLVRAGIVPTAFLTFESRPPLPLFEASRLDTLVAQIRIEPEVTLNK